MSKPNFSTNLERLTASEARDLLIARDITSADLVGTYIARIAERDKDVGAWAHFDAGKALEAARASDARRARGEAMPPLAGIPVGVKDIIDTKDYPTELGSEVFAGRQPSDDAFVVSQLKAAGAIVLGKTVTTELAFFGPGKTRNPHDPERTPGGSSSGSAAAVADGQAPLALGTQTAGSVIRPASYCGVIGFKPTFGYTSRTGVLAQSPPLDTIGGYARSVEDIALLFDCMSDFDAADGDMTAGAKPSLLAALKSSELQAPRLAFVKTPAWPQGDEAMRAAFEGFASRFGIAEMPLPPEFDEILRLQQIVQFSDIARNYGPIADANPDRVSAKLKEIIAEGRTFSQADYDAARKKQNVLYGALRPILDTYDAILTPAAAGVAPVGLGGTGSPMFNGLWTYLEMPCISLPLLEIDGLPLGVQLVGARGEDARLLRVAAWLMKERGPKP
ncbi:amidase [Hyphomicrobium sp.]|uniref:amidase n=1 Tax=Hyphomicrobium sp. TaxID=82 RepID=UPI001D86CBDB|nr:amidase [Hyphomicrobium sp.]MBY0558333.1 amidase [Hyphomicrobium sp.]